MTTDGAPFYLRGMAEWDFLACSNIAESRNAGNSEWACRLGVAISESAGCAQEGAKLLQDCFQDEEAFKKAQKPLGLKQFLAFLEAATGQEFLQACMVLNKVNDVERSNEKITQAVQAWLKFFKDKPDEKEKAAKRLARAAGRMYLFAMDFLERLTFIQHPTGFAKEHKSREDEPLKDVASWIKDPRNEKKLARALAAAVHDSMPKAKAPKRGLLESIPEPQKASAGSDSSDSSEASNKKKKKPKKAKKSKADKKKHKKKGGRKEKKDKSKSDDEKDKKSSSSSSSGSSSSSTSSKKSWKPLRSQMPYHGWKVGFCRRPATELRTETLHKCVAWHRPARESRTETLHRRVAWHSNVLQPHKLVKNESLQRFQNSVLQKKDRGLYMRTRHRSKL